MSEAVSVVVPAFHSASSLSILVPLITESAWFVEKSELILVDDGSSDSTWQVIQSFQSDHVRGFRLSRNFGQHAALLAGIRAAQNPVIITMDDDLQHPPEEVPRLIEALDADTDLVYGAPRSLAHSQTRNITSRISKRFLSKFLSIAHLPDASAFRAFRRGLRDGFNGELGPSVSIDALLSWSTTRIRSVEVRHSPRLVGSSNYSTRKLFRHLSDVVTGYSTLPLRLATLLGITTVLFSIGILAFVILRPLMTGESVPGFPFLASTVAIFSGTQLLVLGILGQYIGRMHFRVMARPTYTIAERTDVVNQ
jgi:glycosyltransferase involved in cell wall biosynthesis